MSIHPKGEVTDLTAWDVIVVNTSGGKDSQVMMDHVVSLARDQGVEDRVVAVHADLGRVEWKGAKALAEAHARHWGIPIVIVKRPQGDLLTQIEERGKFPSPAIRFCTSDQKRGQVRVLHTDLAKMWRKQRGFKANHPVPCRILDCLGFRAAEGDARALACESPLEYNESASSARKSVSTWLPIGELETAEVWEAIHDSGIPYHFAYDLGMPRLSCCFCFFADRNSLLIAGEHNRDLLDQYCDVEERIGHDFTVNLPLVQLRSALDSGERGDPTKAKAHCWAM